MGLSIGLLGHDLGFAVKDLERLALDAMQRCCAALEGTGPGPNAALTRWFGDNSAAWRKEIRLKIVKMRSILNAQEIICRSEMLTGDPDENMETTHFTGGMFGGPSSERVTRVTDLTNFIKISPNFKLLPRVASPPVLGLGRTDLKPYSTN
jgi:hypothetical protein